MFIACVTGCKVGPNYHPPTVFVPPTWSLDSNPRLTGEVIDMSQWWDQFQDPVLNFLIHTMLNQNLTLREAGQRVMEVRARRGIAVGNLFPQVQTMNGSYSKSRASSQVANFFSFPGVFTPNLSPDNWQIGLATAWELDFWGKYRRAIEVADATLDATIASYDEATVILLGEVASSYVEIRTIERRQYLAQKNLDIQRRTLQIARDKKEAGIATAIDVAQAESNYGQTAASLPSLEILRRHANHRLCVLLGRPPQDLADEIGLTGIIPRPPQAVCYGVPADLLRRRPDIRKAERELAAQSAHIGIAKADFYPHISLIGSIGYQAEDFSHLASSAASVGVIAPNFSWNILNYGRIKNNVAAETAAFHRLAIAYRSAVLNAEREAEDAQVSYVFGFDRAASLGGAVNGAEIAVTKALETYQAGSIDYNRVFVLQVELLRQQDQLAQTEGDIAISLISMFKAAGGGWNASRTLPCTPTAMIDE